MSETSLSLGSFGSRMEWRLRVEVGARNQRSVFAIPIPADEAEASSVPLFEMFEVAVAERWETVPASAREAALGFLRDLKRLSGSS